MPSLKATLKLPEVLVNHINLLSSDSFLSKNRYAENFAYGHQEILLRYMDLNFSTQIIGIIEHGASRPNLLEDVRSPRFQWGRKTNFWAWSNETEELAKKNNFKNVKAIGAPWLYLKKSVETELKPSPHPSKKFLVMPSHSTGNASEIANLEEKKLRAKNFRDVIGDQYATVCLHAADFCDPDTRESFETYGFNVTCVGSSLIQPPWSSSGNRIKSLYTLMKLMLDHSHFITDHYGTALIYAVDLGLDVSIFPEIKKYQNLDVALSEKQAIYMFGTRSETEFLLTHFSEALNKFAPASEFSDICSRMLGVDAIMSSKDLKEIMQFRENVYLYNSDIQPW
jgi:hypothetical protein